MSLFNPTFWGKAASGKTATDLRLFAFIDEVGDEHIIINETSYMI